MKKIISIICLMILIMAKAEPAQFRFRHITIAENLPSNSVRNIVQDKNGFIWFGTDNGLCRYDGLQIKIFPIKTETEDQYVTALMAMGDSIWIGTEEGVMVLNCREEKIYRLTVETADGIRIGTIVSSFSYDGNGGLWISTKKQGVFRYRLDSTGVLDHPDFPCKDQNVSQVMVDHKGRVWAITNTNSEALYMLDGKRKAFVPVAPQYGGGAGQMQSMAIFEDSRHNIWLGTWKDGLYLIDGKGGGRRVLPVSNGLLHIHSIAEYKPGTLLVGSDDGMLLYDTSTGAQRMFTPDDADAGSLSNKFVYSIMRDREGGVWVGTFYGGVNYAPPFFYSIDYHSNSSFRNSVSGNVINRFCEDRLGRVWMSSDDGGVSCYDSRTGRFAHYLQGKNAHALCLDGDNMWVGTYSGGVILLDTGTGEVLKTYAMMKEQPQVNGTSCYALLKDSKGRIWATTMGGINIYDRRNDRFVSLKQIGSLTIDIKEDAKGNIWFATQGGGVFRYDPGKKVIRQYRHNGNKRSLPDNQANCIYMSKRGEIWIGTMAGLCRYDPATDDFTTQKMNIPSNDIAGIAEVNGVLWLTTTKGIVSYIPGKRLQTFGRRDGLQSEQFMPNACLYANDGNIYAGSVKGFYTFRPSKMKLNNVVPNVMVTGIDIMSKPVAVGSEALPLAPGCAGRLELDCGQDDVTLHFASLSYCNPEKHLYACKLEGYDKEWIYTRQSSIHYGNLSSGKYVFRLKATNNDGLWSEEKTLEIVIRPSLFAGPVAITVYILLALAALWFGFRLYRRHVVTAGDSQGSAPVASAGNSEDMFAMPGTALPDPLLQGLFAKPEDKFIETLKAAIMEDISNPDLNVNVLAEKMGMSRSSMFNKIKQYTDKTPNEIVQALRMQMAARLLKERRHRINEICYMVGFSSPSYFSKCFQKQFGKKPAEYVADMDGADIEA